MAEMTDQAWLAWVEIARQISRDVHANKVMLIAICARLDIPAEALTATNNHVVEMANWDDLVKRMGSTDG